MSDEKKDAIAFGVARPSADSELSSMGPRQPVVLLDDVKKGAGPRQPISPTPPSAPPPKK